MGLHYGKLVMITLICNIKKLYGDWVDFLKGVRIANYSVAHLAGS